MTFSPTPWVHIQEGSTLGLLHAVIHIHMHIHVHYNNVLDLFFFINTLVIDIVTNMDISREYLAGFYMGRRDARGVFSRDSGESLGEADWVRTVVLTSVKAAKQSDEVVGLFYSLDPCFKGEESQQEGDRRRMREKSRLCSALMLRCAVLLLC